MTEEKVHIACGSLKPIDDLPNHITVDKEEEDEVSSVMGDLLRLRIAYSTLKDVDPALITDMTEGEWELVMHRIRMAKTRLEFRWKKILERDLE